MKTGKRRVETMENRGKDLDIDLLKNIMRMNQTELYKFLFNELRKVYSDIDVDGIANGYLFCKGDLPIMVVSHLDTVFEESPDWYTDYGPSEYDSWNDMYSVAYGYAAGAGLTTTSYYPDPKDKEIFHDREEEVIWSPDGLGADDRVGVFLTLSMVRAGLKPSILFTTDEESGSASGRHFAETYRKKFKKLGINYIMQLDRSGYNDCVFYQCESKRFEQYIKTFGWETAAGSFSDISVLCPVLKVAGVNLSVGYFNEHSQTEMVDLFTMSKNYDIIYYMVEKSIEIQKPYKYIPKVFKIPETKVKKKVEVEVEVKTLECPICDMPMVDYVYAKDFGKICLDCYLEIYK